MRTVQHDGFEFEEMGISSKRHDDAGKGQ